MEVVSAAFVDIDRFPAIVDVVTTVEASGVGNVDVVDEKLPLVDALESGEKEVGVELVTVPVDTCGEVVVKNVPGAVDVVAGAKLRVVGTVYVPVVALVDKLSLLEELALIETLSPIDILKDAEKFVECWISVVVALASAETLAGRIPGSEDVVVIEAL